MLGLANFFVPRGWIRARNGRAASFHGPRALQHTCILDTSRRFFPTPVSSTLRFCTVLLGLAHFPYPRVGSGPVMAARPHHIARAPPRDGWRNSCARAGLGAAGRRVDRRWLGEPPAVGKTAGCRGNRPWRFWFRASCIDRPRLHPSRERLGICRRHPSGAQRHAPGDAGLGGSPAPLRFSSPLACGRKPRLSHIINEAQETALPMRRAPDTPL